MKLNLLLPIFMLSIYVLPDIILNDLFLANDSNSRSLEIVIKEQNKNFSDPSYSLSQLDTIICSPGLVSIPASHDGTYPISVSYLNNGMPEVALLFGPNDSVSVFVDTTTLLEFSVVNSGNCSVDLSQDFLIIFQVLPPIDSIENTCDLSQVGIRSSFEINQEGCQVEHNITTVFNNELQLEVEGDQFIEFGDSILLKTTFSFPADISGTWTDQNGLILCKDCLEIWIAPTSNASYTFTISNQDCILEKTITISVRTNEAIYFPNAFSPNNDGNNDIYQIYSANNNAIVNSFRIYSRWGDLVFEAIDLAPNDPNLVWNGIFKNKKLASAVYVYIAEVTFPNGRKRSFKGDITLIR